MKKGVIGGEYTIYAAFAKLLNFKWNSWNHHGPDFMKTIRLPRPKRRRFRIALEVHVREVEKEHVLYPGFYLKRIRPKMRGNKNIVATNKVPHEEVQLELAPEDNVEFFQLPANIPRNADEALRIGCRMQRQAALWWLRRKEEYNLTPNDIRTLILLRDEAWSLEDRVRTVNARRALEWAAEQGSLLFIPHWTTIMEAVSYHSIGWKQLLQNKCNR